MASDNESTSRGVASLVYQIHNTLKNYFVPEFGDEKMSFYEVETLDRLVSDNRKWTITRLAQHVGITQPGMSTLLRSLENKKIVKIKASTDDRRQRIISPTRKGLELRKNIHAAKKQAYEDIFSDFSEDDLKSITDMLTRLHDTVVGGNRHLRR